MPFQNTIPRSNIIERPELCILPATATLAARMGPDVSALSIVIIAVGVLVCRRYIRYFRFTIIICNSTTVLPRCHSAILHTRKYQ
jgi:hypothetical protein